ncbi:hypothetical protein PMIN05_003920 [Paraphaeosphaeria minitans]
MHIDIQLKIPTVSSGRYNGSLFRVPVPKSRKRAPHLCTATLQGLCDRPTCPLQPPHVDLASSVVRRCSRYHKTHKAGCEAQGGRRKLAENTASRFEGGTAIEIGR